MILINLDKLVKSLSASEKKYFRLNGGKGDVERDYIILFDLIDTHRQDNSSWVDIFSERYPNKSLHNTASYLFKLLSDVLVRMRIEQDSWYLQHFSLMKAKMFFERSIPRQGLNELKKVSRLAGKSENHEIAYSAARMQLTVLADLNFPDLSEQNLVDLQMKAKNTIQAISKLHEYSSLYELLKHRITKGDLILTDRKNKKINDLVLSELSLGMRKTREWFEPKKIHLLFQSFFFTYIGDYHSAIQTFYKLNILIEANENMWDNPPYDYLSALDGILDSLRSIGYYKEMSLFINKIVELTSRDYPDHFKLLATYTARVYSLNQAIGLEQYSEALGLIQHYEKEVRKDGINGLEKLIELRYFESLIYFQLKQVKQASKTIKTLLSNISQYKDLQLFRAIRLLNILIAYEQDDILYIDYETRSYKRYYSKFGKAYKIEKLLFHTIFSDPKRRSYLWRERTWKSVEPKIQSILADKKELSLLKYFNYCRWIEEKYQV